MQRVLSSVRGRIVVAAIVATSLAILVVGFLVLAGARRDERAALDERLERRADLVATPAVVAFAGTEDRPVLNGLAETLFALNDTGVRILRGGRVLRAIGAGPPESVPGSVAPGVRTVRVGRERWRVVTRRVRGLPQVTVEVSGTLEPVQATVRRLRRRMLLVGLGGLLIATALAALFSNRAVAALGRLRHAAGDVADTTDLDRRVPTDGPREVQEVAEAINALLARLERSTADRERAYDATRRFAADAGHELRTPLAVLGTTLETLDRNKDLPPDARAEIVAEAMAEQRRLTTLVGALQALTRGDAGALGDERDLDLASLAREAIAAAHRAGGVRVAVQIVGDLPTLHTSPSGLRLLLDNLLRNAALHARGEREHANVACTLTTDGEDYLLTVDDDGPGIPPDQRDAVRARFVRGAASSEGSGLGLALVDQQARLLHGTLTLGESPAGGLRAQVRWPLPTPVAAEETRER